MGKLRIIFLLLSSCLLFLNSCSFNKLRKQKTIRNINLDASVLKPVIPEDRTSAKYKTEIDVLNKHFTGIIVLKQTDDSTKHLVFVTELGMRMFDFIMRGDKLSPDFVFDALNKPNLVKALTSSFRDILLISSQNKMAQEKQLKSELFYWINNSQYSIAIWKDANNSAQKLKSYSGNKKHSVITYESNYDSIKFKQYGIIQLKITLSKIKE